MIRRCLPTRLVGDITVRDPAIGAFQRGAARTSIAARPPILVAAAGVTLAAMFVGSTVAKLAWAGAPARSANVIAVSDKIELHLQRAVGETLYEEGSAKGTLSGTAKIKLRIDASKGTASASFMFYVSGGTISGRSSGGAHGGNKGWESFDGELSIDGGSARYAHASGSGKIYGAIYRRTDRLIVQEYGRIRY